MKRLLTWILILCFFLLAAPASAQTPATLSEYWEGKATWQFYKKIDQQSSGFLRTGHDSEGVYIQPVGNTWYMFHRKSIPAPYCTGWGEKLTTVLHISTDRGQTWGSEIPILEGRQHSPDECAATDGSPWFNATENRWYYLYQCLATKSDGTLGAWNGCLATRDGTSPAGIFTPVADNPVVTSGELWRAICDTGSDDCVSLPSSVGAAPVGEEGTFSIFRPVVK